jgi:hypothetical protein
MKEDEMGGACSIDGSNYKISARNPEEKETFWKN